MKRLVLGILAHVDSGKTTLTEAMLYRSGAIRAPGRVDHGDAFLDTHSLERERGITIFSKQALLPLPGAELTLLDTPGHIDFSAEMERTLSALDYAILVISGGDGIQSHTLTLWRLLEAARLPVFIFVNKMDLAGADRARLFGELRARFGEGCVDFTLPRAELDEQVSLCDELLLERFLENGSLETEDIRTAIARRRVFPCWFGSALKLDGVDELLGGLAEYTRTPPRYEGFAAKVFKVSEEGGTRLAHMVITGGVLRVRDELRSSDERGEWREKVSRILLYSGAKYRAVEEALPGMAVAVAGLTRVRPGDGLGLEGHAAAPSLEPVLSYRAVPEDGTDIHTALERLRRVEEEDPQLHVSYEERLGEIHVRLMGQVQLEILKSVLEQRFGMRMSFERGGIVYRETPAKTAEGVGHYEPLRHYAEVHLLIEPGERGSGLVFDSICRTDQLDTNWQRLILYNLEEKTHLGVLTGSPLTDAKITLLSGRAHLKHTEGGDFRQATLRAVRQGLRQAGTLLLEPWYDFVLTLPQEAVGRAMNDVSRMGGEFSAPEQDGELVLLRGRAPVSEMVDYQAELVGYTHGMGRLSCTYCGYFPCHNAEEVISAAGYDCDADIENTADSVFCSHGAGFVVPWDKVPQYMHLPAWRGGKRSVSPAGADSAESLASEGRRAARAAYSGSLAEDKELLKIFERTYGPIKRDLYTALMPTTPSASYAPRERTEDTEYLLVDGYNIIFAWDDLSALARDSLEAARARLIDMLCNYRGVRRCELIVVFDAYRVQDGRGSVERAHNINVVYTREAETADMYIERVTHSLASHRRVRVATSDGLEQLIVLGQGAQRISASAFRAEVDAAAEAIRAFIAEELGG